jgi:flagellar hook-associated protein 2
MSAPITQWQAQQASLQTQTTAINKIQTDVTAVETSLNALGDPLGALSAMNATSSDSAIVNASAADGTAAGSHIVIVTNIASTASAYSGSVATSSTLLTPGAFTLQVGTGTPAQITIGSGVNTLDDVATYINGQSLGVTASVVNDASGARLAIVSNTSGSASGFTISNSSSLSFTQTAGKDAALVVDGIPVDSASNTVTGVVNGLTLNLVGALPGGQITINIAPDATAASQAIATFVGAYNTAINDVNAQYATGVSNRQGPLGGDSTLRMLQDSLLSAGSYSSGGSAISTLSDLGITMNNDGTLTLNSSTLTSAVQNNFSAVQNFMQGAASNGFVSLLHSQLYSLTNASSGAFTVDLTSINSQNKGLQTEIDDFQTYLDSQKILLTAKYTEADITLQQLPSQLAQLNAMLGYTTKTS